MAVKFPQIKPTTRNFTFGDFPSKTYRSLSGAVFRRSFGNKQTGHTLNLTFKNIDDDTTTELINHYQAVSGTFKSFELSSAVTAGMTGTTGTELTKGAASTSKWHYAEPPKFTSVKSNLSTVTVKLISEIDV